MFKSIFKAILYGAVCAVSIAAVYAGTVSTFTGPSGTNPANQPQNLSDYNYIINNLNSNAAWGGNGVPSASIAMQATTSAKLGTGSLSQNALQILNSALYTTVTGASTCNITGAGWCLGIFDNTGTLHWLGGT